MKSNFFILVPSPDPLADSHGYNDPRRLRRR